MNRRGVWTIVIIFAGLFVLFFGFSMVMLAALGQGGGGFGGGDGPKVGVVEITGPIMDSKKTVKDIRKFASDDAIKALVIRVDSPGGAVAPSQEIFDAVLKAKDKKPLVVSMGSTAASGGYYIAIGSDTIFANSGTVTGSIGVITQIMGFSKLVEKAQVDVHTFTTGPYKDAGSPLKEMSERDKLYFKALIDDIYEQFVADVAKRRKLKPEEVRKVADGRVFTGRQALKHKLVDKIGTLHDAVAFVAKEAKLEGEPKLVYPAKDEKLLDGLLKSSARSVVRGAAEEVRAVTTPVVEYRMSGF